LFVRHNVGTLHFSYSSVSWPCLWVQKARTPCSLIQLVNVELSFVCSYLNYCVIIILFKGLRHNQLFLSDMPITSMANRRLFYACTLWLSLAYFSDLFVHFFKYITLCSMLN
jgi:hypothetical protein